MSGEIEAAGDLINAGLVAQQIEHGTAPGTGAHAHVCANCKATLTGHFCHACGQRDHVHRSLLHLGEELLHGLFHFDTKAWRTLPLLILRPGVLTRRYIDGQRTRYVSPLALFLFMIFLMFFAASLTSHGDTNFNTTESRAELEKSVKDAQADVTKADANLAQVRQSGKDDADAVEALADAKEELQALQTALAATTAATDAVKTAAKSSANNAASEAANTAAKTAANTAANTAADAIGPTVESALSDAKVGSDNHWLNTVIQHAKANPELTLYKLKGAASKYSFLLVPLSLPFMWLLFVGRRNVTVFDHAVFVLYSVSFMALLFVIVVSLAALHLKSAIPFLVLLAPPLHMGMQLRETYQLGIFSTLWRTFTLTIIALIVLTIFAVLVLAIGLD